MATAWIEKLDRLLGDAKHTVTLKQDEGVKPDIRPSTNPELEAYQLKARHAVRILIAEGVLEAHHVKNLAAVLGVPVFGIVGFLKPEALPPDILCYAPMKVPGGSSRLTPAKRRELRAAFSVGGVLDDRTLAKLDRVDGD